MPARRTLALLTIGVLARLSIYGVLEPRIDGGDPVGYLRTAHHLVEFGVFSDDVELPPQPGFYRPPLYPAFLAGAFVLWDSPWFVRCLQLVLSLVTAFVVARIARKFDERAANWVLAAMLLSPVEAAYATVILSETLTTLLLASAAAVLLLRTEWWRWALGGALAGLLALCRDIYLPLLLLVAGAWAIAWKLDSFRKRARDGAVFLACAALVIAPWALRNQRLAGRFVAVSEGRLGLSLWMGTWATNGDFTRTDALGYREYPPEAFRSEDEKVKALEALGVGMDRRTADAQLRQLAMQRYRDEPVRIIGRWLKRAPKLWLGTRFDLFTLRAAYGSPAWTLIKSLLWGFNALLVALGVAGMAWCFRKRREALWCALPLAFTAAVYLPLNSFENRYSQPVFPFVVVFAGLAAVAIVDAINARRRKTASSQ
ncbi:MAG: hypothetical protein QM817_42075 [Archangium sp.]